MRWLLLTLLAACTSAEMHDALLSPAERCAQAQAIYDTLPEPTLAEAAAVVAACM